MGIKQVTEPIDQDLVSDSVGIGPRQLLDQ
jgi:hypothetical protein